MNAYPRDNPVKGSIINLKSHILPIFSNNGIKSSSNISLGILPTKISQPAPGGEPSLFNANSVKENSLEC